MHTLVELKQFLESKQIHVKSYNGWQLVVGKETWGMINDVYYCGNTPVAKKEILKTAQKCIEEDKKNGRHQSSKTRKWRGIGGGSIVGDGSDD